MHRPVICCLTTLAMILFVSGISVAADIDEFKVKRQEVFEFTEKPKVACEVTRQPDRFVVTFASKAYYDATVAIEDANGVIVRHLASGVLGPN